ncbi:DUF7405 family protein [Haloplanus halobius]|uniref:DUF7405 family protein n=1 Tax=Haloplanus halobius TaxID=2934938 RepID=UPI00200BEDFD|nr:Tat pathway signal protein [Haloplanus sp. XH21]
MRGFDSHMSRRSFGKIAVSIGGATALAACTERTENAEAPPGGSSEPWTLPSRQHAWNESLNGGNLPRHHVLLFLNYTGQQPTSDERETIEGALKTLERAYEWSNDGLLFTLGYSPAYFDRFDDITLPSTVRLPEPEALTPFESPTLDQQDVVLHLASDRPDVVLRAEQALFGDVEELNGVQMETRMSDVFDLADRRTGFIGEGLPAEKQQDVESLSDSPVPDEAPEFMGFKTPFRGNQPSEDDVTIQDGPFAGSTTQHIEYLDIDLDRWYKQPREKRVGLMFSPEHASEEQVGEIGEQLGEFNGVTEEIAESLEASAEDAGYVGHAQKAARGRNGGTPTILRRDFDTIDDGSAGLHFVSLQSKISDYTYTRKKIAGVNLDHPSGREIDLAEIDGIDTRTNNGILNYITTIRRGNFLIPRRELRALPTPRPE